MSRLFLTPPSVGEDGLQIKIQFCGLLLTHLAHLLHNFVFHHAFYTKISRIIPP